MLTAHGLAEMPSQLRPVAGRLSVLAVVLTLAACGNVLEVSYPGRTPVEQLDDPKLAPVLAAGVVGDLECAYNNYFAAAAIHSDEFETSNAWDFGLYGERQILASWASYAMSGCDTDFNSGNTFGLQVPMHTARFQAEDVYGRLSQWTDAQVPDRVALQAKVLAFGAYAYAFLGETYCTVAFDGGPIQDPAVSLAKAAERFAQAISLATQGGGSEQEAIINLSRVGLARVDLDLKKWTEAASVAAQVPVDFELYADRGTESTRRWNKLYYFGTQLGAFAISEAYRVMNDPRVPVQDAGRDAAIPGVELWITTKYADLGSPIRLASYREARLILAEARAELGDVAGAMEIINLRRAELSLPALTATDKASAVTNILEERRRELAFEGGHRLNDLLRRGITWKATGTNSPYTGRPYGTTTCWPTPTNEVNGY